MAKIGEDFPHSALLIEAGYTTEAKIDNASDEDLLAINHLGPAALAEIRAARQPEEEAVELVYRTCSNRACGHQIAESPCPYCGTT